MTRPAKMVSAKPFLDWIGPLPRAAWNTGALTETQVRYVDRALQRRPEWVDVFVVDEVLVAMGAPHMLSILYPEDD